MEPERTRREREAYEAGRQEATSPPGGQKAWTAGAVAGGGISASSIANIIGWNWPDAVPVAPDLAAIIVAIGSVATAWGMAVWNARRHNAGQTDDRA